MEASRARLTAGRQQIELRMARAAERAGLSADSVRLIAVTKTLPVERIQAALDLGLRALGENRVQEAKEKFPRLAGSFEKHLIGHLQGNKARAAAELFDWIQSVDSLELARRLSRICGESGRTLRVLWEVNTSGEASKFGFDEQRLRREARELAGLPGLEARGLMTLGPAPESGRDPRPCFRALFGLRHALEQELGRGLPELSMGMSGDFEIAVEEGSTMVRIGTALFGPRES